MWHAHDGMAWWMLFGGLLWLAFWAFMVYAISSFLTDRKSAPTVDAEPRPPRPRHEDPMDIARRRYAAGDISGEEFVAIVETLSRTADSGSSSGLGRAA